MTTETRCALCGGPAVIKPAQVPAKEVHADGTSLSPSQWNNLVDCPSCGTIEQRADKKPLPIKHKIPE